MQPPLASTKRLEGRVALVTGAGRGIGRACALAIGGEGATVVLTARTGVEIESVKAQIEETGGRCFAIAGDVRDETFVEELFAHIEERFGRLDILVNNAGTAKFGLVEELPVQALRDCLELNVVAVFLCLQAAIRLMKRHKGEGKIINIGSVRSHWTEAGDSGAYNASKYALRGLTESVARELHGSGVPISVGMVCPGIVNTSLTNAGGEPRPDWLEAQTVAQAVLHAVCAPPGVNVFDTVLFPLSQKPW